MSTTGRGTNADLRLANWLDAVCALDGVDREACAYLRAKLAEQSSNLVVVGQFKRGKSTLINALLGAEVLPVAVVPLTAVVTLLHYGDIPAAQVTFENGEVRTIAVDAIAEYVTEAANPRNVKKLREATVQHPSKWLREGIRLVDTPGIGSLHDHNTEVTYRYLPRADAVILVIAVDQPASRAELDFLVDIRQHAGKVFAVLNKADHLSAAELQESVAFTERALAEATGGTVAVFPVSARLALQGKLEQAPGKLRESRLPAFADAVRLEHQALTEPLERVEANIAAFAAKKHETLQARSDYDTLITAEAKKLVKRKVEPDLDVFKPAVQRRLGSALGQWYKELRPQGSAALQEGLERRLQDSVRQEFEAWRCSEDAEIGKTFDALCARFWNQVQTIADELLRYSAALFAIPFQATRAESLWQARSGFYYKFWQEPPSMVLLRASIARWLPAFVGQPLILRRARRRAVEPVEMQAGRLRHDFEERIKAGTEDFRRDMLERLDATITGIEEAVTKGMAVRQAGVQAASSRLAGLGSALETMDALETAIRQDSDPPR